MNPESERLAAASGFIFVVLFIAAVFMFDFAGHDDSDEALIAFYAESGNRARIVAGAYLLGGAGLSFLWFSYHLRVRLQQSDGLAGGLAGLGFSSALVFVVLLFAVGATQGPTYAASIDLYDEPQTQLTRIVPHQGYSMLAYGFLSAALSVSCTSVAIKEAGLFPGWLSRAGFAVAVLLLPGLLFAPIFLSAISLVAWVLAVSFVLFRKGGAANGTPA